MSGLEPTPVSPVPAAAPLPSVGRSILQAFKGEHHDYTTAPLQRALILLAVPMVMEMLMESLFALSDIFWVSRLGKEAVAVVGLTESLMTLIYAVAIGLAIAASAVVARRIGEKDPAAASGAAGQTILIGTAMALGIGVLMSWQTNSLLGLMGAEPGVIARSSFTRIMLGGNITVFLIFTINAIFRGAGDPVYSMRTLWLANGLNIVLGPCFIFGWGPFPQLGVAGAAVATNIGRGIGILYQLWHLAGGRSRITVHLRNLRPDLPVLAAVMRPAWSGMGQFMVSTTAWIGLFKIVALFGSSALAGFTIAVRVFVSAMMPAWGLSNASATLVGQNLGARQPARAEEAVGIALRTNLIFLGAVGLLYLLGAPWIIAWFTGDPAVYHDGVSALRIFALGFPFFAASMVYQSAFNGAGDTATPTRMNFYFQWLVQVPAGWLLARVLGLGLVGVEIAVPLAFVGMAAYCRVLFRRGDWKMKQV